MIKNLTCLDFQRKEIGKILKATKILNEWTFIYKGTTHSITFFISKLSHKKEIFLDFVIIFEKQKVIEPLFQFSFWFNELNFCIKDFKGQCELTINDKPFTSLLSCKKLNNSNEAPKISQRENYLNSNYSLFNNFFKEPSNLILKHYNKSKQKKNKKYYLLISNENENSFN